MWRNEQAKIMINDQPHKYHKEYKYKLNAVIRQ